MYIILLIGALTASNVEDVLTKKQKKTNFHPFRLL